jgi:hypothetical protein
MSDIERYPRLMGAFLTVTGLAATGILYRIDPTALVSAVHYLVHESGRGRLVLTDELLSKAQLEEDIEATESLSALRDRFASSAIVESDDPLLQQNQERFVQLLAPGGWAQQPIAVAPRVSVVEAALTRVESEDARLVAREISGAAGRAERLASSIAYLGPLRDDPRVAYPLGHTVSALPVGEKGEFTAAFLVANTKTRVAYKTPDDEWKEALLSTAVAEWCSHLDIAQAIHVRPMGKLGHQLRFRVGGAQRDPTAIGVGASQLLPVVVLVLGAPPRSMLLLEQPELHLHPKVQARLADFFMKARPDLQLVIETHSEYLVTRIRLRIAEQKESASDIAVLFAIRRKEDGDSGGEFTDFKALSLDELGDFDYWPPDFFDSLDADMVALSQAIAARLRRHD